ncbi:carbohydrate-binding domain-containing protein [Xanthocytophaga flava]|uniref:carbohydrate-binding domain-containing protein n=1 Tax=Xanthocytophaga flava TaxID=3048013 RepID=UPI0028D6AD9A|nr:carbohydrate-binding domain-containing protein [Xanthocytophaga flavus]MDJ1471848.1 carbohydrate-binding domain-containing protein [Xanthocytophaga flavus]
MIKVKNSLLALAFTFFTLVSCSDKETDPTPGTTTDTDSDTELTAQTNTEEADDYIFDTDITYITLNSTSVAVTGEGVTVENTTATITAAGTYSVSGTLTDGQVVVNTDTSSKVKIILNGAYITSTSTAPLYVKNAAKTIIYLTPSTQNTLTDGSASKLDGTLYSAARLSIFGTGSLTVTGNADGGIVSEGGMIIKDGTYAVTAAESTLKSDKNLIIDGGTFTLTAGNDGIHGEESLIFNGGNIVITQSEEGIESAEITINEGTSIQLTSTDDGVNASSGDDTSENHFYMHGGYLYVNASGDGIDSNGYIEITGGVIVVNGPTQNSNGAIDYDRTFTISGGLLVAAGSTGMAQAPSQSSTQNSVKINFSSSKQANQLIHIQDATGNEIITFSPAKTFQSVVVSSPSLIQGTTYSVYLGGSSTGTATNGLYEGGDYTAGTLSTSFTVSSNATTATGS